MKLQEKYKKEILPKLKEKFGCKNDMQLPRLIKVACNVGIGRNAKDKNYIENVADSLKRITGQQPILTKAKKSIAAFKVREGSVVGVAVTLRGKRMFDFLDKLINVVFPNVRDFRGIDSKCIDNQGNITVGIKEHIAFPEIRNDEVDRIHGMEVSVSTTAQTKEQGLELFKLMGFPFKHA